MKLVKRMFRSQLMKTGTEVVIPSAKTAYTKLQPMNVFAQKQSCCGIKMQFKVNPVYSY